MEKFESIILLYGWKNRSELDRIKGKFQDSDIKVIFFQASPNYPVIDWLTIYSMAKVLRKLDELDSYVFHVRGEVPGYYLLKALKLLRIKKPRLLVDIRGASIEEISYYSTLPELLKRLKIYLNKKAMSYLKRKEVRISAVSKSLKNYLLKRGFSDDLIGINHCIAGSAFQFDQEKRKIKRDELGLRDEDICIVFSSGGGAAWQNYQVMYDIIDANKKLIILNLSKSEITHMRVINRFVSYQEVPDYLCAADYGLLIRDDSIVNKVACPVKLVEYICCGLLIIHNDTIGIMKDYDLLSDSSLSISSISEIEESQSVKQRVSMKVSAENLFSAEKITKNYLKVYGIYENTHSM